MVICGSTHQEIAVSPSKALGRVNPQYPPRVAFTMIASLLDEFAAFYPSWTTETRSNALAWSTLTTRLSECQDPANFDKIVKIQKDLDSTTAVLHQTIDASL